MGKKSTIKDIKIKKILDRKEDSKEKYIYYIKYSNGETMWKPQRKINEKYAKTLLKEYDKNFPKIERRGRKKKKYLKNNENILKENNENLSLNINNQNEEEKKENLNEKYNILQLELKNLKDNNYKIQEEINLTQDNYNNICQMLKNISKENLKLKENINSKKEELNSIKEQFNLNKNDSNKKINKIIKDNQDLKKLGSKNRKK